MNNTQLKMLDVEAADKLNGRVVSVRYRNEESGYTIATLEMEGGKKATIVGALPEEAMVAGVTIAVQGDWQNHARYGKQYRFDNVAIKRPTTLEGIEAFLSSGLIPGLGKKRAADIVKKFGDQTLHILDTVPMRLVGVQGIGRKTATKIADAWATHQAIRSLVMMLASYGVTTGLAMRIHAKYGSQAESIITTEPYRLVWEMEGVGFRIADAMALKMGTTYDAQDRISAALSHVYSRQTQFYGHCYVERTALIREAYDLLGIDPEKITAALDKTLETGRLLETHGGIYNLGLEMAERLTAQRVHELLTTNLDMCIVKDSDAVIQTHIQQAMDIDLTPKQMQAVIAGLRERVSVITGGPGTGKTTIIKALLDVLPEKVEVAMMSPTGRAAKRMTEATGHPAMTIHRGCGYNPAQGWTVNEDFPLEANIVIVDEASMLDISVARHLFEAIPDGAHVILVGDVDQLPSVGPGNFLRDIIESGHVPVTHLEIIHRQAETSTIITASHAVNCGDMPQFAPRPGEGDVFFFAAQSQDAARDLVLDLVTSRIPTTFEVQASDVQVLGPMKRGEAGVVVLNQRLQALLNPKGDAIQVGDVTWRVGDRVMQTRNNYDYDVFNGDLGKVAMISREDDGNVIYVEFDEQLVKYSTKDTNKNLLHAWAMTIHKSQGSEFPVVVIPLLGVHHIMLQRNLLYTAMTRAKQVVVLVGERSAIRTAVNNMRVSLRNTALKERIQELFAEEGDNA